VHACGSRRRRPHRRGSAAAGIVTPELWDGPVMNDEPAEQKAEERVASPMGSAK
jgi:hypothetical protein